VSDLIDRIGGGIAIHTRAGFPVGSGLGVSSILAATIIHALRVLAGLSSEHADLIERSLRAEQLLGSRGGWQDVAGGIYGGIKSIVSDAGAPSEPQVEFVNVNSEVRAELRDRLVLCYTGEAHFSGDVISTLIRDFENRTEPQWSTRRSIALLDQPIVESLQSGDFNQLGNLLREFWESFLILVPEAQTLVITRIIEEVGDLTSGYKACGAGGGGCFMLVANEGLRGLVNQKLESMFRSSNIQSARILDWEFDEIGLRTDSYT
jgi:galactokinase/mevalonate kinase-like predicted kinase